MSSVRFIIAVGMHQADTLTSSSSVFFGATRLNFSLRLNTHEAKQLRARAIMVDIRGLILPPRYALHGKKQPRPSKFEVHSEPRPS